MVDADDNALMKAVDRISTNLSVLKEKAKISEAEIERVKQLIKPLTDMKSALRDVDIVIEAVPEDLKIKKVVFSQLDSEEKFVTRQRIFQNSLVTEC